MHFLGLWGWGEERRREQFLEQNSKSRCPKGLNEGLLQSPCSQGEMETLIL